MRRFEGVGEIDADALIAGKAVAGFGEFEADFHVRNRIRRHHQFVAIQARQQVRRHVVVPRFQSLRWFHTLLCPLLRQGAMDDVDDFHQECGGAGGGVKDDDERFIR